MTQKEEQPLITQAQQLLSFIKELMIVNNLTELDFSILNTEEVDPVYVIWYDRHCTPYDDPVLKVFLDENGLSLEVDARDFGNTVRLYEDDFAHEVNWLTGIRENVVESLKNKALIVIDQQTRLAADLVDRERQWQKDVKEFLIDTLHKHGGRITFVPKNARDEYPVTTTLYDQHDFPRIDICSLHLDGGTILADGLETEDGPSQMRYNLRIEREHLSDAFSFARQTLNH